MSETGRTRAGAWRCFALYAFGLVLVLGAAAGAAYYSAMCARVDREAHARSGRWRRRARAARRGGGRDSGADDAGRSPCSATPGPGSTSTIFAKISGYSEDGESGQGRRRARRPGAGGDQVRRDRQPVRVRGGRHGEQDNGWRCGRAACWPPATSRRRRPSRPRPICAWRRRRCATWRPCAPTRRCGRRSTASSRPLRRPRGAAARRHDQPGEFAAGAGDHRHQPAAHRRLCRAARRLLGAYRRRRGSGAMRRTPTRRVTRADQPHFRRARSAHAHALRRDRRRQSPGLPAAGQFRLRDPEGAGAEPAAGSGGGAGAARAGQRWWRCRARTAWYTCGR